MSSKRNKHRSQAAAETETAPSSSGWSPVWKIVVSALLAFHVFAVFLFPMAAASSGSPSIGPTADWLRPYAAGLYLDHGYAFFAPNPGPSHLVEYRLEFDDGRPPIVGRLPDLKQHWPRLWYHRHFMLAEHLNAAYAPPQPPPEASPEELERWRLARNHYERHVRAFQEHLLDAYDADRVTLVRLEHLIPSPNAFAEGKRLDDAESFVAIEDPLVLERSKSE